MKIDMKMFENYYSADYFVKTTTILKKYKQDQVVTMQWFQRTNNITLCGMKIVIEILRQSGLDFEQNEVLALEDGEIIDKMEPVLKITGHYQNFGYLEGVIDGVLSRASSVASNCKALKEAANGIKILNMNDRADFYENQQIDGYASYIGGIPKLVTPASYEFIEDDNISLPQGTMPHALIEAFDGDVLQAAIAYNETFPDNDLTVLVDYNNDCVTDTLIVARHFKDKLKAIRIDTSKSLLDKSLQDSEDNIDNYGVSPALINNVRNALDNEGFNHVKIIVSSGFGLSKIERFVNEGVPVDAFGVGEALTKKVCQFTGDAVMINGKPQAKFGRQNFATNRIKRVK